ncbi:DUF1360 domain-containing protein [Aquibacillus halophilus]|uniref:DUF1360 domain-containing protein n=1 Tax=Aquibacillus halophilus TaxID=930132 RepID=A0A6A8DDL0_9BACI|nr:DUF1360 domain-containing protein [Aquibacillus halophilus]MRH43768.1 DUF1360 domain-containing protein [Aquibacillus halophilus]
MITWFNFILLGLATFRLTRLAVYDDITRFLRAPFHEIEEEENEDGSVDEILYIKGKGVQKFIGEMLSCQWCTGIWSATIIFVGYTLFPFMFIPLIIILSLAAVGSIIQLVTNYFSVD